MITYRRGTQEDVDQIVTLLDRSGLFWPGAAATPYVAVDDEGTIRGVYFKCVCFHIEPLAIEPGHGVSVTELGKVMRLDFEELATEMGHPLVAYAGVQNNPRALAAAEKNGLKNTGLFLHEIVINPLEPQPHQVAATAATAENDEADIIAAPPPA